GGKPFLFEATDDGDYWFATRTVDVQGNAAPLRPQLAVRVDSTKPQVTLRANPTSEGPITVSLQSIDEAPSAESIRLEYAVDHSTQWTAVPDLSIESDP